MLYPRNDHSQNVFHGFGERNINDIVLDSAKEMFSVGFFSETQYYFSKLSIVVQ